MSLSQFFILFIIYSFLGWIMEVIATLFSTRKLVNRGFLIGPICPIYGTGVSLMYFCLRRYLDDPIVLFVMSLLICSILEYFTGYIMEKLFKARWWDYSDKKFNINGRVCLDNLLAFGILGLLVMYVINPFFMDLLSKVNPLILNVIAIILFVIVFTDLCISFKVISGFKNVAKSVNIDNTEEITKRVRDMLVKRGGLYKRLVSAFDFSASEKLLKNITDKVLKTANKAIINLEKEKDKKIKEVALEYDKRINGLKKIINNENKKK